MDRDSFITAVFLLGCEQYGIIKKQYRPRRGGFEPALTDEEVITMEICGEYFKLECCSTMNAFDKELVAAGGWLAYADRKY